MGWNIGLKPLSEIYKAPIGDFLAPPLSGIEPLSRTFIRQFHRLSAAIIIRWYRRSRNLCMSLSGKTMQYFSNIIGDRKYITFYKGFTCVPLQSRIGDVHHASSECVRFDQRRWSSDSTRMFLENVA